MEDTKAIILRKPIAVGEVTYDKLELREPVAKELSIAQRAGGGVETTMSLIQQIAGLPRRAVEQLPQRELMEADQYLGGFSVAGPTTGETS